MDEFLFNFKFVGRVHMNNYQVTTRVNTYILFIIGLLLFKPAPGYILGSFSVIGFSLLTLLIATLLLLIIDIRYIKAEPINYMKEITNINFVTIYIYLAILSFIVSTLYGMIVVPDKTNLFDFLELYRYAFYFVFFVIALKITQIEKYVKPLFFMFIIIEVFGIFQSLNILNINEHIGLLYTLSERHFNMIVHQRRIPSTFLNPNMYGSFLVIIMSLLLAFITFKTPSRKGLIGVYLLIILTVISIILTTSRTAVIVLGGIIVYWILFNLIFNRYNVKAILAKGVSVLLTFILTAVILIPNIAYLDYAANQIYNSYTSENDADDKNADEKLQESLESVSSFKNRYDYWQMNYEEFLKSPIIGHGPMRQNFVSFADNTYLYILPRYGIIGLLIFLFFVGTNYIKSINVMRNQTIDVNKRIVAQAVNLIITGYLVMGMVSEVWFNLQSMVFFFLLLGVIYNKK
jgi:O-antigen ligase